MIKFLFTTIAALFLFASCSTEGTDSSEKGEAEDNFTIEGVIEGAANTEFYLETQGEQGSVNLMVQVKSDASGKFSMKGNVTDIGLFQLRMGESSMNRILLTLVPGDKLSIQATTETFGSTPKATGTTWSQVMSEYMVKVTEFRDEQMKLSKLRGTLSEEELNLQYLDLKKSVDKFALAKMKQNPGNPFNLVLSTYAVPSMDFQDWNPESLEILKRVSEAFTKNHPSSNVSATLNAQVYQIELAYDQYLANSSGTRPAPEIALKNPDGKEIRLSSLKGNYVLIDFWASWCAPCRQESPNVVKMYNKYKNKGFTVYSVSLDNNVDAWKAAIAKDGMVWPNHVSDLLQWKSPMPQLYGFNGIPHTVLVNKEGMIIGTGLRGAALEQKLKEIFEN